MPNLTPPAGPGPRAYRRLTRSTSNRILGGVCAGVADYTGVDPTLIRVVYVLLTLVTGGGLALAYPVLWLLMPPSPAAGELPPPGAAPLGPPPAPPIPPPPGPSPLGPPPAPPIPPPA